MTVKYFCDECGELATFRIITELVICPLSDERGATLRTQTEVCEIHRQKIYDRLGIAADHSEVKTKD